MRFTMKNLLSSGVSAIALLAAIPAIAAEGPSTDGAKPDKIETVVVTANKREQSVLDVAGAVNVIAPADIQEQGLTSLTDWAKLVPGMSFFGRGTTGFNQIILRGVTSGSQQISPTVGFYVNDAPYSFSIPFGGFSSLLQPDLDPFDLERIEVLKGPQGTLYGASTLGGLIKYVTKTPSVDAFTVATQVGTSGVDGGGLGYTVRAAVNLPLSDDLALRVSGFSRRDPGFIDNVKTGHDDANSNDSKGVRASLGYYPTENFHVLINGLVQDSEVGALGANDLNLATLVPIYGPYKQNRFVDENWSTHYRLIDGSATWDFEGFSVLSSTSYALIHSKALFDFSPALPAGFLGGSNFTGPQHGNYDKFSEELRVTSTSDSPLSWIFGGFYTQENANAGSTIESYDALGALMPELSLSNSVGHYHELAVFGNVTYTIADQLDLTGGLRWTSNGENTNIQNSGPLSGTPIGVPVVQSGNSSESVVNYLGSVNWRFSETGSLYAKVASGYRPGGPVEPPPAIPAGIALPTSFNSDRVVNYEIGEKSSWYDDRLQSTLSAFYVDWSDIQLPFIVNGFRVLTNGGGATSQGAEWSLLGRPIDSVTATFTGSYTDAHLTSPVPLLGAASGDRLPYVPKWTLSASLRHDFPVMTGVDGFVSADWSYVGSIVTSYSGDASNRKLAGYNVFGLQAGLMLEDKLSINFFARNLADTYALTSGGSFGATFRGVVLQPRTIGILVSKQF